MLSTRVNQWLSEKDAYRKVLGSFSQPLTARQISKKTGIPAYTCSYVIARFVDFGVLVCLNSGAQSSRLYGLTESGHRYLRKLHSNQNRVYTKPILPDIDWSLYGFVCFGHRSAVLKALAHPMQPSEIKRLFRLQGSSIRISANNIRDIIRLFTAKEIVRPVKIRKKAHLRYELTDLGTKLRRLLMQAEAAL